MRDGDIPGNPTVRSTHCSAISNYEIRSRGMHYLYGSKPGVDRRLVATFGSEQQLLAYVRWATLSESGKRDGKTEGKFEQGSALAGYRAWEKADHPLTD